jgi:tRNA A-37 threonylcarbamoyl transferase component Bud32
LQNLLDRALGKYIILEEIGRGGMATVYKARDVELDRIVAIKVLSPYLVGEPRLVQRFMGEARLAANLDHPNIVTIYDIGGEGGYYYFVMKYLEGRPLKEILNERGPLPPEEVLSITRQLAAALDYAHHQNLIHRDVKPGNVIISPDGQATLTDFGLAKVAENLKLTASGEAIGTLEYMAPEQARGDAMDTSDIYSLGVLVYEMLTGRLPFQGTNQATLLYQHLHDSPPPLRQWMPNIPPEVEQVVLKAMAKDPAERYQRATDLAQELEQAARKGLLLVPGRHPAERAKAGKKPAEAAAAVPAPAEPRPTRRLPLRPLVLLAPPFLRRWWWAILAAAVLLAAIVTAVVLLLGGRGGGLAPVPTRTPTVLAGTTEPWIRPGQPLHVYLPITNRSVPALASAETRAHLALLCNLGGTAERLTLWQQGQDPALWPGMIDALLTSQVSWSPGGEWLVAAISEEGRPNLFRISLDGTKVERLTGSPENKEDPAWSPDGTQIAYADGTPGKRKIYLIQADGSNPREKTRDSSDNWSPAWSPDGLSLVFVSNRDGNTEIYRLDLVHDQTVRLTESPGEDVYPSWSPDGQRIAFLSNRDGDFSLYTMAVDGQGVQRLYNRAIPQQWLGRPAWSPDSAWLAFTSQDSDGRPQVLLLQITTGQLYTGPVGCHWPAWKPK